MQDCVVVGAGISGLMAARALSDRGHRVMVLDKGRGVGGRMSTRRRGPGRFDHGAQSLTAGTSEFQHILRGWRDAGAAEPWCSGFPVSGEGERMKGIRPPPDAAEAVSTRNARPAGDQPVRLHYRGLEGMDSIPKHLAAELRVQSGVRVREVSRSGSGWCVRTERGDVFRTRSVLLTAPVPQSLELLDAGRVELLKRERDNLNRIEYRKCLAAMVQLSGPSKMPEPGGMFLPGEPLQWIADNHLKGISPEPGALTIHAGPRASRDLWALYRKNDEEVTRILVHAAREWIGSRVVEARTHGWLYSETVEPYPAPCFPLVNPAPAVIAGDAFGGVGIEGAALSGLAAAKTLLNIL